MKGLFLAVLPLAAIPAPSGGSGASELTRLVKEIRSADFRAERAELRRLASSLDSVEEADLAPYREYWRGFALWRSAINGGNETPTPADVTRDLEAAVQAFRGASQRDPGWIEPRIGLLFCWVGLAYAPGADAARSPVAREEFAATARAVKEQGERNPRALWFVGGSLLFAPADRGGDPARAAESYRRGLLAARAEASANGAEKPGWVPAWGAAENLMSLAYAYTHGPRKDRELAQAYAEGALAVAPEWHYVRDILLPQIEALPAAR